MLMEVKMTREKYQTITPEEFERNAVDSPRFREVGERLVRESVNQLINPAQLRRDRDWSYLSGQVVGAEV